MFTFFLFVLIAVLSFCAGRASGTAPHPKRDKRGRFMAKKAPAPRRFVMPTLPQFGPQHLAVMAAALAGVLLASMCPVAMAPVAFLLPMPLGVAAGRRIITPTKSVRSYRTDLARGPATAASMWEDWAC